ncbi:hypothetical protein NHX12_018025 [Muraenolepis orangiensis]|uniref:Integrator complex subunit 12 n=1 Tax=Muraenolepis orangiensis TaxID=630683 RepID=A0A9Q0EXL0_9TELE|nr:hypothetical protein NHX12_018025 [Muraenolepis orangiensis]
MSTTLSLELDPVFLRGLGYLHSKTKDSAEKLKALLDESMSRGSDSSYRSSQKDIEISKSVHSEKIKKETEKRPAEKVRVDLGEVDSPKKPRLEKQESRSSPVTVQTSKDLIPPSINDYDETNADDFAMEMGLACVVCRQMTVTMGNQLVECQECHNLYHQDCHKPQVTDKEANDPRLIWYCARCTRQMKRLAQKAQKPPQKSSPVAASVAPVVKDALVKKAEVKSKADSTSSFQAFKRTELKTSAPAANPGSGVSSTSGSGLTGWAAFVAKTTPSSTMSSTKLVSSGPSANTSAQKPAGLSGLAGTKTGQGAAKPSGGNGSGSNLAPLKQPPPLTLGKQSLSHSSSGESQGKAPSSGGGGGGGSPGSSSGGNGGGSGSNGVGNSGGSGNNGGGNGNTGNNGSKVIPGDKAPTSQESQLNAMKRLQMVKKKAAQKKLKK